MTSSSSGTLRRCTFLCSSRVKTASYSRTSGTDNRSVNSLANARSTSCVNRAHYQNVTFVLLKNGEPIARIVPDSERVCVGRDLAEALAKNDLPENEARVWHRDLEAARKSLKAPADKWP
jgi:antitoxin (DNA-binding transcriptional repressor) of toxin-antitoxin stability system